MSSFYLNMGSTKVPGILAAWSQNIFLTIVVFFDENFNGKFRHEFVDINKADV